MRTIKEDWVITLRKEGNTWDEIAHKAKTSPKTISKVLDDYEQSEAFKLFDRGYTPMQVRIELSMPPEKVERHFLAYRKLHDLADLSYVYDKLGAYLPEFLNFYGMAEGFHIQPENMREALDLARDIENLKLQAGNIRASIYKTRTISAQEAANLAEIRRQVRITADNLLGLKNEISCLEIVLDKIKSSSDYGALEQMIGKANNSLSSERNLTLRIAIIAVMKTIQEDPSMIPLFQFPVPPKKDMTYHTSYYQHILVKLISTSAKFMPKVIDELSKLIENNILLESHKIDVKQNKRFVDRNEIEVKRENQTEPQTNILPKPNVDVTKSVYPDQVLRMEENSKMMNKNEVAFYLFNPYSTPDWDELDDSWYYMYC
jgi:hypothetical protein